MLTLETKDVKLRLGFLVTVPTNNVHLKVTVLFRHVCVADLLVHFLPHLIHVNHRLVAAGACIVSFLQALRIALSVQNMPAG